MICNDVNLFLILAAVIPALWLIRHYVKHDVYPEPRGLIIKTVLMGIVIVVPIVILELLLDVGYYMQGGDDAPHILTAFFQAFVIAGFTEEFFKYLVLKKYCSVKSDFDEPMDGIVYAVLVSLGFALLENIMYVMGAAGEAGPDGIAAGIGTAVLRAFTAVPAHASFGVIMGFYFSNQHFGNGKKGFFPTALLLPILWHGAYNFLLLAEHPITMLAFIPFLIYLFKTAKRLHRKRMHEQLSTVVANFK